MLAKKLCFLDDAAVSADGALEVGPASGEQEIMDLAGLSGGPVAQGRLRRGGGGRRWGRVRAMPSW
jgi:hypothetical protein